MRRRGSTEVHRSISRVGLHTPTLVSPCGPACITLVPSNSLGACALGWDVRPLCSLRPCWPSMAKHAWHLTHITSCGLLKNSQRNRVACQTGGGGYSPQQPSHKRRFDDGPEGGPPDAKRQAMAGAPQDQSDTVFRLLVQAKKVCACLIPLYVTMPRGPSRLGAKYSSSATGCLHHWGGTALGVHAWHLSSQ